MLLKTLTVEAVMKHQQNKNIYITAMS